MAELESTMQWKVDITSFTKAMQEAKKALQSTNSEFKLTTSTMDKWSNNTAGIEAKLKQLGNTLEAEKRILDIYSKAWEEAKKEFGETSPEAERLAKKVEDQQIKINKTQVSIDKYTSKLNEMQKEQTESESALSKTTKAISDQETKLSSLKDEYKNAVLQYGKNSKEAKALASEIDNLSKELADNKKQLSEADKAADELDHTLDDTGDSAIDASEGFTIMKGALANLVAQGISKVVQGLKDLARQTFEAGSNFEAGMSKVAAISGASGEELDQLTTKAKEMGEKTKFSATEAASAFEYMAMAGWKASDMIGGIEGIMNLAAASGEDLATTSDIVTDALTAFGLSANDSGQFADVLAQASANANTNVSLLGESFKYVAPLAGTLGYTAEDTSIALGLMANAGIKGSQAGTSLKTALANMSSPTESMAGVMKKLNISLTDADGNMRSLRDVMDMLRKNMAVGSPALKEFTKQTAEYTDHVAVSAEKIATLSGAEKDRWIQIGVGSDALEGLTNAESDALEMRALGYKITKDRKITDEEYLKLCEKLGEEQMELGESQQVAAAATLFGKEAMAGMLNIINASEKDYVKLTKAIDNSTGAAEKMAETMNDNVSGKITLLKSKVEGIMIKVFEKASDSIKKSINTISKALDGVDWNEFADNAGDAAETIADFFAFIVKNGSTIVSVLKAVATAFVTYQAVSTITSVFTAFKTLFEAVKAGQTIMEALNLTMAANPYALVAAGIAALGIALGEYAKHQKEAIEAEFGLTAAQKEAVQAANDLKASYDAMNESRTESQSKINSEFWYLDQLQNEYNNLIDANGKVKAGYEGRAEFILGELAKAFGMEKQQIRELIDENGKLSKSIDDLIIKKKAEAALAAEEENYKKAIADRAEAWKTYTNAQKTAKEAEDAYTDSIEKNGDAFGKYQDMLKNAPAEASNYYWANRKLIESQDELKKSMDEANAGVKDAETGWMELNTTIKNYEGLMEASITGDVNKINESMLKMQNSFITAESGNRATLELQVQNFRNMYRDMDQAVQENSPYITKEMADGMYEMYQAAKKELDKLPPAAKETGEQTGNDLKSGVESTIDDNRATATVLGQNVVDGAVTGTLPMNASGVNAGDAFVIGVNSKIGAANAAGVNVGTNTNAGAVTGASPMNSSGVNAGTAFVKGVDSKAGNANAAGKNVGSNANAGAVNGSSPMNTSGTNAGNAFVTGVNSKAGESNKAGNNVGSNANSGAVNGASPMNTSGANAGGAFVSGVESKAGDAEKAGSTLGDKAKAGSETADSYSSGSAFGEGFFNGIGAWISKVWEKAKELAQSAWSGLKKGQEEGSPSKLTRRSGAFFGEGYALGIEDMIRPVTNAASDLAKSAVDALGQNMNAQMRLIGADGGNSLIDGLNSVMPDVSGAIDGLKGSIASVNTGIGGVNVASAHAGVSGNGSKQQTIIFNQTNNSPKALDRLSIYRQTNNMLFSAKVRLSNV